MLYELLEPIILKYFPRLKRDSTDAQLKKLADASLRRQEAILDIEKHVILIKDPIQKAYWLDKKQSLERSLAEIDKAEKRVLEIVRAEQKNDDAPIVPEQQYESKPSTEEEQEDFENEMVLKRPFTDKGKAENSGVKSPIYEIQDEPELTFRRKQKYVEDEVALKGLFVDKGESEKSAAKDDIIDEEHMEYPISHTSKLMHQKKESVNYSNIWNRIQRPLKYAAVCTLILASALYSNKHIRNYCNGAETKVVAFRTFNITEEFKDNFRLRRSSDIDSTTPKETPLPLPTAEATPEAKENAIPPKIAGLENVVSGEKAEQSKTIGVHAVRNWGLSNYALINLGFASFDELNRMDGRARTAMHNKLNQSQRNLVKIETDAIYEMNKDHAGFKRGNKNYVRYGATITMEGYAEGDLAEKYASISVGAKPEAAIETVQTKVVKKTPPKKIAKTEINRAGQKCAGDYAEKERKSFNKAYYFDTNNYTNASIYGITYPKIRGAWNKYIGSNGNDGHILMQDVYMILSGLPIVKDANGKLRFKPAAGVDGKPVPGIWISNKGVCGILNALRDDLWAYSKINKDDEFNKKFNEDMPWIETQFVRYKQELGLVDVPTTQTLQDTPR